MRIVIAMMVVLGIMSIGCDRKELSVTPFKNASTVVLKTITTKTAPVVTPTPTKAKK